MRSRMKLFPPKPPFVSVLLYPNGGCVLIFGSIFLKVPLPREIVPPPKTGILPTDIFKAGGDNFKGVANVSEFLFIPLLLLLLRTLFRYFILCMLYYGFLLLTSILDVLDVLGVKKSYCFYLHVWCGNFAHPSFECETFLHVLHGKQYDKQVQGGSVHIIEPGILCVSQKNQKRCV